MVDKLAEVKTEGVQRKQVGRWATIASTRHSRTRRNMWCYACFALTNVQGTCKVVPPKRNNVEPDSVPCVSSWMCRFCLRATKKEVHSSDCMVSHAGLMSHAATCRSRARVQHRATSTRLVIMSRQDTAGTHRASTQSTPGTWFQG